MTSLKQNNVSRRTFLKQATLGVGAVAAAPHSFAWQGLNKVPSGIVASTLLENTGRLAQDLMFEQFSNLLSVSKFKRFEAGKLLIVLSSVSEQSYPYSVDNKLLFSTLKQLTQVGVAAKDITVIYRANDDLDSSHPLLQSARMALDESSHHLNIVNTFSSTQWQAVPLSEQLPVLKLAKAASQADTLIYLGQNTDNRGQLMSAKQAIADILIQPESVRGLVEQRDVILDSRPMFEKVYSKVKLLACNSTSVLVKEERSSCKPQYLYPGLLSVSDEIESFDIFSRGYLQAVTQKSKVTLANPVSLKWLQANESRDPLTFRLLEKGLLKAGVQLEKVLLT